MHSMRIILRTRDMNVIAYYRSSYAVLITFTMLAMTFMSYYHAKAFGVSTQVSARTAEQSAQGSEAIP